MTTIMIPIDFNLDALANYLIISTVLFTDIEIEMRVLLNNK